MNAEHATFTAAEHLTGLIAAASGMTRADAWDQMTRIPENMLTLLDYPEGWTTLSHFISTSAGCFSSPVVPTIH